MKVYLNQEQAEELCREWQAVLGIQDWHVRISVLRKVHLAGEVAGCVKVSGIYKKAWIQLMAAEDIDLETDSYDDGGQDMERTLVHELMHLVINDAVKDTGSKKSERVVESMAKALVSLKRKGVGNDAPRDSAHDPDVDR